MPAIAKAFTKTRFKKILENIHLNDNETAQPKGSPGYDKLHKLRPLIEHLNANFKKKYVPSNQYSVDESMVPFKGRSSLKQYMPLKPVKRGYKIWVLADAKSGFIMKFDPYTGKDTTTFSSNSATMCEKVVLNLCDVIETTPCLVAYDNFFTTYNLMLTLKEKDIYSVGTVRMNRKNLPDMLKKKTKMERGEFQFEIKDGIAAVKWQDNQPVTLLSSYHNPKDIVSIERKQKDGSKMELFCPKAIESYNDIMGGVDHFDQFRER